MHRRALLTSAAILLAALAGCSSEPAAPKPMPAPDLTGAWAPMSAVLGGRDFAVANFHGGQLVVAAGNSYDFAGDRGQITLLPGTRPPYKMDIQGKQGPNAGRTILAAYMKENEDLVVCYQLARDGQRPESLNSPEGTQILLVRFKRVADLRG